MRPLWQRFQIAKEIEGKKHSGIPWDLPKRMVRDHFLNDIHDSE